MPTDLEGLSQETLDILRKATSGILVSTGVQGVDLSGFTSLVPVNVPARNNTSAFPRVIAGEGSQVALWRTWLNQNSSQYSAAVGNDYAGSMTQFLEQDVYAPYRPLAKAGRVTLDAVAVARNYVDALAQGELQTLNQLFIAQDMNIINSQAWPLGTPGAPSLTTSTTGGSIAATTAVYVRVAARSGANYFEGGSTIASTDATITTGSGSTNSVTASLAAIKGAVAYDWYVGASATATAEYYVGTTTVASIVITAIPGSAPTSVPSSTLTACPLISTLLPGQGVLPLALPPVAGSGAAVTSNDTSYSSNYYNGVLASTLGDYGATGPVQPGTGTASGATFIDAGGAAPTLSGGGISILDQINDSLWASVQLSPTAYMVNSLQADEISKQILSSSSATTFLPPTDADARTNLAGGGYIGRYINRAAGGVPVMIEVHPRVAPGTIIARTDRVPFPGSNIGSVFEVRCQYDTMRFDYAANYNPGTVGGGPRYDFEIRSMETLVNRAPVAQAVVGNVG
jgi:hypothetical protein